MNEGLIVAFVIGIIVLNLGAFVWEFRRKKRARAEALAALSPEEAEEFVRAARAKTRRNGLLTALVGAGLATFGIWTSMSAAEKGGMAFYGAALVGVILVIGGAIRYLTGRDI